MMNINLNDTPDAILTAKAGDLFYIDNHRMEFRQCADGRVYLSATYEIDTIQKDDFYVSVHVRGENNCAVFGRYELFDMIASKNYYIR